MMFLEFLELFWPLIFGLLIFCKCSVPILVSVFLLCPFSVNLSIKKSVSLWRYFQCIFCRLVKENLLSIPLWHIMLYNEFGFIWFYFLFPKNFKIVRVVTGDLMVTSRKPSGFFRFSNLIVYCIDGSWLFISSKNCNDFSLALNLAWLLKTNLLKIFGTMLTMRAYVLDMYSIHWR